MRQSSHTKASIVMQLQGRNTSSCYPVLLDPDATMSIDLHKWLFLLVSGRGE
jgi:hypothetical protein